MRSKWIQKHLFGYFAMVVVVIWVAVYTITQSQLLENEIKHLSHNISVKMNLSDEIAFAIYALMHSVEKSIYLKKGEDNQDTEESIQELNLVFQKARKSLQEERETEYLDKMIALSKIYIAKYRNIVKRYKSRNAYIRSLNFLGRNIQGDLEELPEFYKNYVHDFMNTRLFIQKYLAEYNPVYANNAVSILSDLQVRLTGLGRTEIGRIIDAIHNFREDFQGMVIVARKMDEEVRQTILPIGPEMIDLANKIHDSGWREMNRYRMRATRQARKMVILIITFAIILSMALAVIFQSLKKLRNAKEVTDAAANSKSEFLANMSHEIRTPLNAIIGMCDLVIESELTRKQRDYLTIIRTSSRSLLSLINDILDFSKIEAGKLDFEKIPFVITDVIDEVTDMFLKKIREKKIDFIVDVAPEVPHRVMADPLRLRQVLVNLTSNALKFTEDGEVRISVHLRKANSETVELMFLVKDEGIGFDISRFTRNGKGSLFDAFIQADGSTTRKHGGTGLGLAICKKIVTMMGGDIWANSTPGKGSTFYFTAKFKKVTEEEVKERAIVPEKLNQLKVLIVEDNPTTLMILKRFMDTFGFRTHIASNAEDALALYEDARKTDPFGLIVMDVVLPEMDGITAAVKIKESLRPSIPPIILMSAGEHGRKITRALEAGVERFLMKPIKQSTLFDTTMDIFGYRNPEISRHESGVVYSNAFANIQVLLVDDNTVNQIVGTEILRSVGMRVMTAENGVEALKKIKSHRFDVIFMDIQMPEMDGMETTKIIREELGLKDLPIIAMTAHAMYGDQEKCLTAGMNDYVPKPIDREVLFQVLKKQMSGLGTIAPDPPDQGRLPRRESAERLDIQEGIHRLGGSQSLYVEVLSYFYNENVDFQERVMACVQAGDYAKAGHLAHAIKGAAGNVSAQEIQQLAKNLEKACNARDLASITPQVHGIMKAMEVIQEALAALGEKTPRLDEVQGNPEDFDPAQLKNPLEIEGLIKSLTEHLSVSDPVASDAVALEVCEKLGPHVSAVPLSEICGSLLAQIKAYQFEDALRTVSDLEAVLKRRET